MEKTPKQVAFLMLENFSMMAFSSTIEPMRAANRLYGRDLFQWQLFSVDGGPVTASNQIQLTVDGAMAAIKRPDLIVLCSGLDVQHIDYKAISKILWPFASNESVSIVGVCTAPYILAKCGLLDRSRCTIHWENLASFREEMPALLVTNNIYEIDGNRMTCSGGTAPIDMMLELIRQSFDQDLMLAVADQFMHERARPADESQKMAEHVLTSRQSSKLAEAIQIMQNHIDDPLSTNEVAEIADVSLRQLERLFKKYKNTTPQRYYLFLRLQQARRLLLQTSLSVLQVTIATGFSSQSHFTKCYRDLFHHTPGSERKVMRIDKTTALDEPLSESLNDALEEALDAARR
ncbi:GlxA family transcriptional regulator [Ostreibacterium oceani]|uniref:Helix-turn-helix domain-containing protein n=1 Tax=Ostreibacterium oceani TaxID=2654998 RepID=A0A6N7EXG3_9GAMM|nr:GlxA family transcriptional regulator [Ostreibacterium oceani]MPV86079.1 helix-turn-helix domain-containing protein [Ostreibacterium oceani]